ncbi:Flagellar two-component response regulator FleR [hydrothermal vent metagenome]|uniref:Flagellar two-component response regulator FleR n=1 Tax=hydrothermal vent metagenome TaxID=652676 RepID=A0A3B0YD73_9ZZZZ
MSQPVVLIVEDDSALRDALCATVELAGFAVKSAESGEQALSLVNEHDFQLVVSDVQMDGIDGHTLLHKIKARVAELPVVLMTAYGTIEKAVESMRAGAADYLVKPFDAEVLVEMIRRYLPDTDGDPGVIAEDPATRKLAALAKRVAVTDATVMIGGESGAGKEVFARLIHDNSSRAKGPFIAINCAAIPENMLEASLFGYEKGAFTGAYQARAGKFEQAQGGTLLLDEISEMDMSLQAKLLRVLQEREVERLGGRDVIPLDVRVLATSNRNMREEVAAGRFREDLFYRLNVFPLHLTPLRERKADILPLANRFIKKYSPEGRCVPHLSKDAQKALISHPWSGNVRELDNVIQRALILLNGDQIEVDGLCFEFDMANLPDDVPETGTTSAAASNEGLGDDLKSREFELILDALNHDRGSRKAVAERLGISPRTLRYKIARMREQGIAVPA